MLRDARGKRIYVRRNGTNSELIVNIFKELLEIDNNIESFPRLADRLYKRLPTVANSFYVVDVVSKDYYGWQSDETLLDITFIEVENVYILIKTIRK